MMFSSTSARCRTLQGLLCAFLVLTSTSVGTSSAEEGLQEEDDQRDIKGRPEGYQGTTRGISRDDQRDIKGQVETLAELSTRTQTFKREESLEHVTHGPISEVNFRDLCDPPRPPENGYIKGHNYSYEAVVTLSCEAGYTLHGHSNLTCLPVPFHGAPGIWVPQDEYQCLPNQDTAASNGQPERLATPHVLDDHAFDHSGQLHAENARRLTQLSSEKRTEFQDIRCPKPTAPANGEVAGTDYSMGARVTYSCDEGYSLIGPSQATCLAVPDPFHHVAICIWDPPILPSCQVPAAPPCLLPSHLEQDTETGFKSPQYISDQRLTSTISNPRDMEGLPSLCSLPQDAGPCREAIPRYFFDATELECFPFTYGGCRGNENNFETFEICRSTCR